MILELERLTGMGVGKLCTRCIRQRDFSLGDLTATIRLALIGGGMSPKRAAELVETYGPPARPLVEGYLLALAILTDLYTGPADSEQGTKGESNG